MKTKYTQYKLNSMAYRGTLIADEISVVAAFFSAIFIRYSAIMMWADRSMGVYGAMLITAFIFEMMISMLYDQHRSSILEMNPIENLLLLIKSRFILIALLVIYFYITHRNVLTSRVVFGIFMLLSVIYGYAARMLCRFVFKKKYYAIGDEDILKVELPLSDNTDLKGLIRSKDYQIVMIIQNEATDEEVRKCVKICDEMGVRAFQSVKSFDYTVRSGIISELNGFAVIPSYVRKEKCQIFGVNFSVARTEEAVLTVIRQIKKLSGQYICFSNVHTTVMAKDDIGYRNVLNGAAYVFADGAPIAKLQQKKGPNIGIERVAGPDFMEHMFKNTMDGKISHYFYGSSPETIEALRKNLLAKYPGIDIRGMYSPPFRKLNPEEDEEDIRRINESGADIVWIGLGAPKQEKWMNAHKDKINGVMMGVGAGFDFHGGTIKRAPVWIQKMGFEWLFRLFQNPERLLKRYFVTNTKFFFYLLMEKLKGENN
ncbi:WecB/TagA/CpsF family glycosyltransferase [Butyrivibrio sp. YAB3001]|uniref:WecB/TagA/CpsF family glycosyltransferase n=1 Tax=Butyrivibrio sp. YAB3001 TaxID=1520812 RepID=UPI0008F6203C|nr:WecB/TagA/CpsF family glycosyltransferase [Butyrivibrio sp. YAB3001]SFC17635.1 polymer biosynthesis protein, WecB/TagA/CpsF family [Butyrivibrio sp. YAB3001]